MIAYDVVVPRDDGLRGCVGREVVRRASFDTRGAGGIWNGDEGGRAWFSAVFEFGESGGHGGARGAS